MPGSWIDTIRHCAQRPYLVCRDPGWGHSRPSRSKRNPGLHDFWGLDMRKILVAGIGLLAFAAMTQGAAAADMPVKAPLYKAPIVVPFSWTGFYVGVNAGYSWGRANTDLTETSITTTTATITTLA